MAVKFIIARVKTPSLPAETGVAAVGAAELVAADIGRSPLQSCVGRRQVWVWTGTSRSVSGTEMGCFSKCSMARLMSSTRSCAISRLTPWIEAARPAILGALLTAVAHGLRTLPETHLDRCLGWRISRCGLRHARVAWGGKPAPSWPPTTVTGVRPSPTWSTATRSRRPCGI